MLYSVGHSKRLLQELLGLLADHSVASVLDVRCYPFSRRNPQFGRQALSEALESSGIRYRHLPKLGGLRSPHKDASPHQGWEGEAFRAFADYMETAPFSDAVDELLELTNGSKACMLCAEADPYRCHRRLISDYLTAIRQVQVVHILRPEESERHRLTPFATITGQTLLYPKSQAQLFG